MSIRDEAWAEIDRTKPWDEPTEHDLGWWVGFVDGAEWQASREPTDAEVEAALARVRRESKAEALREAAENVDVGALADAWTRGAVTRLSVTNAVAEVLMSLRNRATEYETGDQA